MIVTFNRYAIFYQSDMNFYKQKQVLNALRKLDHVFLLKISHKLQGNLRHDCVIIGFWPGKALL